jgi:hypothetical protein
LIHHNNLALTLLIHNKQHSVSLFTVQNRDPRFDVSFPRPCDHILWYFLQFQEFNLHNTTVPLPPCDILYLFHFLRVTYSTQIKSKCENLLDKTEILRINLNLDGTPIVSKCHTHPSHSETCRLLTSSLSSGVPVSHRYSYISLLFSSRFTSTKYHVDFSTLDFSLSSHRPSFISLILDLTFSIHNKQKYHYRRLEKKMS